MRKLLASVVAIALVATPALAQKSMRGGKEHGGPQQQKSEEQKKAAQKLEKDYKAALDSIPNKKYDPWGSVRPAANSK